MKKRTFAFGLLVALALPAFAQQARYYGVDHHASLESACKGSSQSAGTIKMYLIGGDPCPYFTTIFFTSKFARAPGVTAQSQEDRLLARTAVILERGLTVASTNPPKDRTLDGVAGREQLVKFTRNISDGYIWEFTDNSVAGSIYVTAVIVTMNPFAVEQNSDAATRAVSRLLGSIQLSGSSR
jgi:hypothetical protein